MAHQTAWLDEDDINPEESLSKKWESIASHTGPKEWASWEDAGQTTTPANSQPAANPTWKDEYEEGLSSEQNALLFDDDIRRWRNHRTLRSCPKAFTLSGLELEESAAPEGKGSKGKRKRKRSKGKYGVRCGRGPGKPRDPIRLKDRPELIVVGDGEFTTSPLCTKVITMIRTLNLEHLLGPYRSYHMFPSRVRLTILKQFLQRYSWGKDQDIGRCLDVFEKIAAANYISHLCETRAAYKLKHSEDKAAWKDFPPPWCKNVDHWKCLCDIWSTAKWDHQSKTHSRNRNEAPNPLYHVAGSRSIYRHKLAMSKEKGTEVCAKEVFDRTHIVKTPEGKKYVNLRAEKAALLYDDLKRLYGDTKSDEEIWSLAVNREDKNGRIFGFGYKSIASKTTRVLETLETDVSNPSKSTATSTSDADRKYSKDEVADLLATDRARYAADMMAQEERHRKDLEELKKKFDCNTDCFAMLFNKVGCPPPPPPLTKEKGSSTKGNGGEGHSVGRVDDTHP